MSPKSNTNIKILLQIILSITFLLSAYSKIIAPGSVEVILIDQGIVSSRELAAYIVRIFIAFEFAIGILFLTPYYLKRFTIPLTWILLIVFTGYLVYSGIVLGEEENCGCFGDLIKMSPIESIIKNIIIAALSVILFRKINDERRKMFIPPIVLLASFLMVFIFSPLRNVKDFQFGKYINFEGAGRVDLSDGNKLLAVFSFDCEHCQHTAKDIAKLKRTFMEIPEVYALFFSEGGITIDSFRAVTNSNFPYHMIDHADFFELIGSTPPRIYWLKDGKVEKYWDDQFVKNFMLEFKK
jgi:hypothetical protein